VAKHQILNAWLSIAIIVMVVIIIIDNIRVWLILFKTDQPIGMNDARETVYCPMVTEEIEINLPIDNKKML
jgi:carbon starvation protein